MTKRAKLSAAAALEAPIASLPGLSKAAADFVRHHPNEAQIAVTAALEAVAVQFVEPDTDTDDDIIPEQLRAHVSASTPRESLLNASEAADRLQVSRTTVYEWVEKKRMLGWNVTRQGLVIPAQQILGPRELVPGLDRVLAVIPQARAAWRFLSEESAFFDEPRRPLDVLKEGDIDAVVAAAEAHGEAFS